MATQRDKYTYCSLQKYMQQLNYKLLIDRHQTNLWMVDEYSTPKLNPCLWEIEKNEIHLISIITFLQRYC